MVVAVGLMDLLGRRNGLDFVVGLRAGGDGNRRDLFGEVGTVEK